MGSSTRPIRLWLAGDVMTGRGVDQILPHPGPPKLRERYVKDARAYVELAERANGPIPRPVDPAYPWGQALDVLHQVAPDFRLINVETSITGSDDFDEDKGIHYRMSPANLDALRVAEPDACALANNHVLDFGIQGLDETLTTLNEAGLGPVGAGRTIEEAWQPLVHPIGDHRILVWSVATESSGVPTTWAADKHRPGVAFLPRLTDLAAAQLAERVQRVKRDGDIAVVSIHWGSNWGYDVPVSHVRFAQALVQNGVDLVHGHSSHHPRPIEVYRGRLILYGCGDLIDDYEGITGYEEFRDDLRLLYFAELDPDTQQLRGLRMVPMQARRMRLEHAQPEDAAWLRDRLDDVCREHGTRVGLEPDGTLVLQPR